MGFYSGKKGSKKGSKNGGKKRKTLRQKVRKAVTRYLEELREVLKKKKLTESSTGAIDSALKLLAEHPDEIFKGYVQNRMIATKFVSVLENGKLRTSDKITHAEKEQLELYKFKMPLVIADLVAMEETIKLLKEVVENTNPKRLRFVLLTDPGHATAESDDQIAIAKLLHLLHTDPLLKYVEVSIILTSTSANISDVQSEVVKLSQGRLTPEMLDERVTWYDMMTFAAFSWDETRDPTIMLRIAPVKDKDWNTMKPILSSPLFKDSLILVSHMDNNGPKLLPDQTVIAPYPTTASSANLSCDEFNGWVNSLRLKLVREITTPETVQEATTYENVALTYGEQVAQKQFNALAGRMLGVMALDCPYVAHAAKAIVPIPGESLGMTTEYLKLLDKAFRAYRSA
jgi:hypothetical protein